MKRKMKRKMKRRLIWAGAIIAGLAAVLGAWGHSLSPEVHFQKAKHPILALPQAGERNNYPGSGMASGPDSPSSPHSVGSTNFYDSHVPFDPDDASDRAGFFPLEAGSRDSAWPGAWPESGLESIVGSEAGRQGFPLSGAFSAPALDGRTKGTDDDSSFNILILGLDAREQESSRADVIMLAHVDPLEKEVNILSIPRDTRIYEAGVGYTKINHVHFIGNEKDGNNGGTQASIQAVSNLLNVAIHYYVKIDFAGFENIIDAIGGVELDLPGEVWLTQPLTPREPLKLPAGPQTLNGELALDYVRERYSREDGEFGRQAAQMEVIRSLAGKVTRLENWPNLPGLIQQVKEDVLDTNFSDTDLLSLAWLFKNLQPEQLRYMQMPGSSGRGPDALVGSPLYYWIPDMRKLADISVNFFR